MIRRSSWLTMVMALCVTLLLATACGGAPSAATARATPKTSTPTPSAAQSPTSRGKTGGSRTFGSDWKRKEDD